MEPNFQNKQPDFAKHALDSLTALSDIYEKAANASLVSSHDFRKERRDLFKYLATIAAGGAALAPQMIGLVKQFNYFYLGLFFLILTLIIGLTYLISTNEIEDEAQKKAYNRILENINKVKEPWVTFIEEGDYDSSVKWLYAQNKSKLASEKMKPEVEEKNLNQEKNFYIPRIYTGEYLILSFVIGIGSIVLSTTIYSLSICNYILLIIGIFIIIILISIFPDKIFEKLGFPIDVLRGPANIDNK